jgi:uncharacterized membrane protein required for colicin V production
VARTHRLLPLRPPKRGKQVDLLTKLNWIDLAVIIVLAAGVFLGYTQGIIRYALNGVAVLVAFILASQLKGPVTDALAVWAPTTPELKELWVFIFLFIGLVIGGWFIVRAFYRRTRLPIVKQLDEIGGAVLGLLFAALVLTFQLVVLDSFFKGATADQAAAAGPLKGYYEGLDSSLIIGYFRDTILPIAGFVARPFVPSEIAALLKLP